MFDHHYNWPVYGPMSLLRYREYRILLKISTLDCIQTRSGSKWEEKSLHICIIVTLKKTLILRSCGSRDIYICPTCGFVLSLNVASSHIYHLDVYAILWQLMKIEETTLNTSIYIRPSKVFRLSITMQWMYKTE